MHPFLTYYQAYPNRNVKPLTLDAMERLFKLILLLLVLTAGHTTANASNTYNVLGDSVWTFQGATPWRCILLRDGGDTVAIRYFHRDGTRKAAIIDSLFVAYKAGRRQIDYYERKNATSTYDSIVRNSFLFGADYKEKHDSTLYQCDMGRCDSHGNWLRAFNRAKHSGYQRVLTYYDEAGYDNAEEEALNARIDEIVLEVDTNDLLNAIGDGGFSVIKVLFYIGWVVLFMLLFCRKRLHSWIDALAGAHITPTKGIFRKSQLYALPLMFFILAMMVLTVVVAYNAHRSLTALYVLIGMAITLLAVLAYSVLFIIIRGRRVGKRQSAVEYFYSLSCCVLIIASGLYAAIFVVALINVLFIALIALIFFGMLMGGGGNSNNGCCYDCAHFDHYYKECKKTGKKRNDGDSCGSFQE